MTRTRIFGLLVAGTFAMSQAGAFAKGGSGGGHRGGGMGPGTGSSLSSHNVRGYVRKDGTHVTPHLQSNPDKDFRNNWSTKGNRNPDTDKEGTRVDPPRKP